jgi:hypothetical protein
MVVSFVIFMFSLSLPDGKSKDLLTMKQKEEEWVEYQNIMEDVIKRSGLDKSIFYDLRGNHDNFGVPAVGGSFDFFSKYSSNGQLGRSGNVNSVTLQVSWAEVGMYCYRFFYFHGFNGNITAYFFCLKSNLGLFFSFLFKPGLKLSCC